MFALVSGLRLLVFVVFAFAAVKHVLYRRAGKGIVEPGADHAFDVDRAVKCAKTVADGAKDRAANRRSFPLSSRQQYIRQLSSLPR